MTTHQKRNKGKILKKKNLYSKEDSSSFDEYDSDSDSRRVIFMAFEEIIENMNHNLLSVSKMCDHGNTFIFNSKECEISEEGLDILVEIATRTPNNMYILNKIGKECC